MALARELAVAREGGGALLPGHGDACAFLGVNEVV
jgi:hypothetical protein